MAPTLMMTASAAVVTERNSVTPPGAPDVPAPLVMRAVAAVDELANSVVPPPDPAAVPPLLAMMALAAVDVPENRVNPPEARPLVPPMLVIAALPAVDVFENSVSPPSKNSLDPPANPAPPFTMVALAAVEASRNLRWPGIMKDMELGGEVIRAPSISIRRFEAVAVPAKVTRHSPKVVFPINIVCVLADALRMPTPLIVSLSKTLMLYGAASAVNAIRSRFNGLMSSRVVR